MDIRAVDLNLLVALDALLAERNVSRAARRLGLSQSALSAQLAKLRELFGDPLLLRTPRGMLPTAKAGELAAPLRQVLFEIGRLVQPSEAFDPARAAVTFAIAATDYVEYAMLPRIVDHLAVNAPAARLAVRPPDFTAIARQLESGEVDLALLGRHNLANAPPDVRSRPLYTERFVAVVRREHPRVGARLTLDLFCELDHVLVSLSGGAFAGFTDQALAAQGRSRRVRLSVPHFLLVPEIIARSDMIAVLPERLARGYAERLRILATPIEIGEITIVEAWHERVHRDPAQAWLRQVLFDLFAGRAPAGAAKPRPRAGAPGR
ncbi:MAG: LysR family transcriptional regulator [Burkholderiales bacterium]|nr:LysR family transcriptional regulator [Burkholderiales bacterium]